MPKRLYITTILIGLLFYFPGIANSAVRTIYFVPNDRVPQNRIHSTIDTQMKAVQAFYKAQMEAHGYAERTFSLETDRTGKVITHTIIGNHPDSHYIEGTLEKVETEINNRFNIKTDIYVVFVDISNNRVNGSCGIARFEGGPVLIPAHGDCVTGQEGVELIAHELGHAFNLIHDFRSDSYIMSYGANRAEISQCAADLLNVSPYFNSRRNTNDQTPTIAMVTPQTYPKNALDWTLKFDITDPDGLYQVQFELAVPGEPASLFDCVAVQNVDTQTRVTFQMPDGATISPVNNIWIRVVDANGNTHTQDWTLTATEGATPVNVIETTGTTFLTLEYNSPDALTPTNPKSEWQTWGQLWEKTPDGLVPRTPNGVFPASAFNGEDWEFFFYSHAPSRIVYDISGKDYKSFHTYFHMPNPCGNSIDLTFYADNTEIHNPGLLYPSRGLKIEFNIPEGTRTFTIKVDDNGDPSCDHFVLGEPTLANYIIGTDTTSITSEIPTNKTFLTIIHDSPNTLTPINPKGEWYSWILLWEKPPNGLVPEPSSGSFPPSRFKGEDWTHFFYSHADSQIVWDISNKNYESFHAHFDMPNPCGNYAKLTVAFYADDTEIYNSGTLQGSQGRHSEIEFQIPKGAKTLTLEVDDLDDPGCDHFVFGEPTLTHSVTTEPPVTTTPTTTTPTAMGNTTVSLLPVSVQSPNIGQLLKLSVKITNGKSVAGYQATVQFDDTALRYVESSNSDYLPDGAFFVSPILEGNLVRLNAASLAGESNGDGTFATLTFEVIAVKASILTLSDVLLSNSTGETFAPQVENTQITEPTKLAGDVNSDGTVNIADLVLVASNLGQIGENAADVNSDGVVNIADLVLVAGALGEGAAAAPTLHASDLERLTAAEVQGMLTQARQIALTDPGYLRGIAVLEQLLALLLPKETALLPNYPNPFNPETWIPYQLAKPAEVTLHIYSVNGTLVRVLALGHQSAGQYQSRSRTAYWDGKNAFGEPVASGLYFYTLTAGDFTATRKMLITK